MARVQQVLLRIVELAFLDNIIAKLTERFRKKWLTLLMPFHNIQGFEDLHNLPLPRIVVKICDCSKSSHKNLCLE